MSKRLKPGDVAIWNDGVQNIPVTIEQRGRDAVGIYCRVSYMCTDGTRSINRVHPAQLHSVGTKRRHADYVYRNSDDTKRVRLFKRESGRWVFDICSRDGSIDTSSTDAEDYVRKSGAKKRAIEIVGTLVSIQVETVRAGWPDTSS